MLVDQKVLTELKKIKDKDIFLRGIIPWYGFNIDYLEFKREKRERGNTGWSFIKMIDFSLTALLSFSNFLFHIYTIVLIYAIFLNKKSNHKLNTSQIILIML